MPTSKLLYNDYENNIKLLNELEKHLKNCETFYFSVAFIAQSGLASLKETLLYLKNTDKKGKIITSTYLNFNNPQMFKELLHFPNLEVRIFHHEQGFHPKGYYFVYPKQHCAIIGSSNLTQTALSSNQEWNLYVQAQEDDDTLKQILEQFEIQWNQSIPLSASWIDAYQKNYIKPLLAATHTTNKDEIKPNHMQNQALESLLALRKNNKKKALLISATGTGKTYLSAFDVKQAKANKMLFVVHRKSIALKAMETFKTILPDKTMGIFSGHQKEIYCDFLFCTIQTLYKKENLTLFKPDEFDYIIIDEVHKAGAKIYQDLFTYFTPHFLLGMSATPERSDQFDIYKLFDYNIACEIRLKQAMEYDLLCPFHYYGITDFIVNGQTIDEKSTFNQLTDESRIDYMIQKINDYGYSGSKIHGLVFVSRKEEAKALSHSFNQRGYKTIALVGEDSENARQIAMNLLESNDANSLDYIFTVDIFNEGIDIPKVNQVIMLRPTQSAIIFIQQLGRGLRKDKEKEYVVIIDFIGNYSQNFLIPVALSGSYHYNKDYLRRFILEGNLLIPGCSTIQFDEISKTRLFNAIDQANFNDIKLIKESYQQLRYKLGRIPHLIDFKKYDAIDPQKIFQNPRLGSYHEFLKKYETEYTIHFSDLEETYLKFISIKLASGKRSTELELIKLAMLKYHHLKEELKNQMDTLYQIKLPQASYETAISILTQSFATGSAKDTFKDVQFLTSNWEIHPQFKKLLNNHLFYQQIMTLLDYGLFVYRTQYKNRYQDTDLCLYQKYTYEDVCQLLNWQQNIVPLNIGGYKYDKHTNTLPVFINYDKDENIASTINYHDHFLSKSILIAMSKSKMRLDSKGMEIFTKAKERKTVIHIFVRKNKDDKISIEFYYLGIGHIQAIKQATMANHIPVCEITYQLDKDVRNDLYDFLTN